MARKLVGTGSYEVVEDDTGRPSVRIRGHIIESGEVFETVLDERNEIVKAVASWEPQNIKTLDDTFK